MSDHKHLDALRMYWREHKAFPSMAKLADVLGLASAGGVFKVVGRLVDAGFLERVEGRIAPTRDFFALPVLGKVRAGLPQMEDQTAGQEMVGVEDYLIRHPERTVFCRVRGESMREAGIFDGDMLVVNKALKPRHGQVVVAVVDGEFTVKYLYQRAGRVKLKAANATYPDITPKEGQEIEIWGVVLWVVSYVGRKQP